MTTEVITDSLNGLDLDDKAYRIAESEDVGRHVILTKDVDQGEIILQDKPLVTGPARHSDPVCISCYRPIDLNPKSQASEDPEAPVPYYACPRCKWPMCSEECANSPRHKPECFYLFSSGCRINASDTDSLYDVIMILRCLYLKDHQPEDWKALCNLQTTDPASMDDELIDRGEKVANLICGTFKLAESFTREVVFEMCGRLEQNSFEIPWSSAGVAVQGVYGVGCMLEHSCIPSAHKSFNTDLTLNIRAAYSLDEGDVVSLCYTDSLWNTAQRREHLVYSKDFLCTCERCQDNTENGSYMSGLKCLKCPEGCYLPDNPLDCASSWACEKCEAKAPQGYSDMAEAKVAGAVEKLEESGLTVPACRKFLSTYSRVLHPNHAHMLDVKYSLLNILGHSPDFMMDDLTDADLKEKEELALCFLNVASKVLPGISRLKGTALYELYLTVRQRAIRALSQLNQVDHSKESILGLVKTAGIHLQDCIDCLQYEPEHRPEGRLYKAALMERQFLMELILNTENKFKN
eukprot:TRINITY_DN4068_c1_g1_i1.p1 TRINITY_DN4068_c1_g1~~TRINITY_DN4068_c1_g1_i1.p1  ORF type:complete len:520 (+),score=62.08 TRINITY_DN4068_c1_g1_i1:37-1596(+)